jgi:spermidine synthase
MILLSLIVAVLSAAILAYQLVLMQLLSISHWYHFAYMVISVALLGFGASGTFISLARHWLLKRFDTVLLWCCVGFAASVLVCTYLSQQIEFIPFLVVWQPLKLWSMLGYFLLLLIPFLFGALAIGLVFTQHTEKISSLYFANLLGSALGGIAGLALMWWFFPRHLPLAIALAGVIAALISLWRVRNRLATVLLALAVFVLLFVWQLKFPLRVRVSEYKSLAKTLNYPDARVIREEESPYGFIQVVESDLLRYAPGLSMSYTQPSPHQTGIFKNAEWVGAALRPQSGVPPLEYLQFTTSALPYVLHRSDSICIIGVGAGTEVLTALAASPKSPPLSSPKSIIGLDLDPVLLSITREYLEKTTSQTNFSGKLLLIAGEGRGFLTRHDDGGQARIGARFDLIAIPLLESFSTGATGIYGMNEDYLFTVESFSLMLSKLRDDGILAVTEWIKVPERSVLKLSATLLEALRAIGVKDVSDHFAAIRSWGTATILIKPRPFQDPEIRQIREFCTSRGFDLMYVPGVREEETNRYHRLQQPLYYSAITALLSPRREEFIRQYPFDIAASSDQHPYFGHFLRWKNLPWFVEQVGREGLPFLEWGYVVILATLMVVLTVSFVLVLFPLLFLKKSSARSAFFKPLLYFGGIGVGYMLFEMVLIQTMTLLLGHPLYSVSAVITGMLLFSGLGSLVIRAGSGVPLMTLKWIFIGILLMTIVYMTMLPGISRGLIRLSDVWRYGLAVLLLAPISFLMGMPFPSALARLHWLNSSLVPWAWGINGFASVVSAVLAVVLSIEFGFNVVFLLAGGCYLVALFGRRLA